MKQTGTSILLAVVVCASGQPSVCSDSSRTSSWAAQLSSLLHRLPSFKLPSCSMPNWSGFSLSQRHKEQVKTWGPVIGVAAGASIATGCYYYWWKTHKPTATPQSKLTPLVIPSVDSTISQQPTHTSPVASPKPSATPGQRSTSTASQKAGEQPTSPRSQGLSPLVIPTTLLSPVRTPSSPSVKSSTPTASPKAIEPAATSPKTAQAPNTYCSHLSCSELVDSCTLHNNNRLS